MKRKFYYVVEKLTNDVGDDIHELTGWKSIRVYFMIGHLNKLQLVTTIEGENANNTEVEIKKFLNNNEYEKNYTLEEL